MGRIDEALLHIEQIADGTERAFQIAGLVSTLFKIKGVVLVLTGESAYDIYANVTSNRPSVELACLSEKPSMRTLHEVIRGQLHGEGAWGQWTVAGVPLRLLDSATIQYPDLCRDFNTEHGIVKLMPAEELLVECILASVYPEPDEEAQTRARLLLINGLTEAFQMDWATLQNLCANSNYRISEDLARLRTAAKKDVDAMQSAPDQVGGKL
jgi:hypothetical protein